MIYSRRHRKTRENKNLLYKSILFHIEQVLAAFLDKGIEIKGAMSQLFSKEIVCQKIYKVRKLLVIVTASYLTI